MSWVKDHWYWLVGGVAVLAVIVFMRDGQRAAELASFFRRKRVEDDITKIKESLAKEQVAVSANDDQLADLAHNLKAQKENVQNASDQEIKDYYTEFFKEHHE
jgi:uncharacterized coiled-coil protein SlyX